MKNKMTMQKLSRPIYLIWFILFLALLTSIVMVSIIWNTRQAILEGRQGIYQLQTDLSEKRTLLNRRLAQEQLFASGLLAGQSMTDSLSGDKLTTFVKNYRQVVEKADFSSIFNEFSIVVKKYTKLRNNIEKWFERYRRVSIELPRAYMDTRASIRGINQIIEKSMGRQRLSQAQQIRKYRQTGELILAHDIITDLGNSVNMTNLSRDINDLALLTEHLYAEDKPNQLADLKDNQFLNIISRLYLSTDFLAHYNFVQTKDPVWLELELFMKEMFGHGYKLDYDHQTIVLGVDGFFNLQQEKLKLAISRKRLQSEFDAAIIEINDFLQIIVNRSEEHFFIISQAEEKALAQAWRNMLLTCLIAMSLFLFVSSRIIKMVKYQITAIEEAKTELEIKAKALYKSETTLLGILRAAPTGIARVNKRLFEWTNEQLQEMVGYTAEELHGKSTRMLYPSEEEFQRAGKEYNLMKDNKGIGVLETFWQRKDGQVINILLSAALYDGSDLSSGLIVTILDISDRKNMELEREKLIEQLQETIDEIKTLSGLLPICASCKKIRDDKGYWNKIELYLMDHTEAEFSHSICPDCTKRLYPELDDEDIIS